jgi:hypothetical protein
VGTLAELVVQIVARKEALDRTLGAARGDLTKFTGFAQGAFGGIGRLAGAALAAAGLGGGIASILTATKKAGDLNEQLSKTKEVFGGSTGSVTAVVDDLATKFGVVKTEALEAASNIGLIARGAGLSQAASADLAGTFTTLAADAASFYNVGIDVALEKIRSGLVGESEPLRSFGILLSEAAVQQEAVAIGAAKVGQKLTEAQKVEARASLIRKGLATATGDLEKTQDSYANRQRKLQGDLENFITTVGQKLIDPMTRVIDLANELGGAFSEAFGIGPIDAFAESLNAAINALRVTNEVVRSLDLKSPFEGAGGLLDFLSGKSLTKGALGLLDQPLLDQAAERVEARNKGNAGLSAPNALLPGERRQLGQVPKADPRLLTSAEAVFNKFFAAPAAPGPTPEGQALRDGIAGAADRFRRIGRGLSAALEGEGPDFGYTFKRVKAKGQQAERLVGERTALTPEQGRERTEAGRSLLNALTGGLLNLPEAGAQASGLYERLTGIQGREREKFGSAQTFGDALSYVQSTQQSILDNTDLASEQLDATKEIAPTFREIGGKIVDRLEALAKPTPLRHLNSGQLVQSGPEE